MRRFLILLLVLVFLPLVWPMNFGAEKEERTAVFNTHQPNAEEIIQATKTPKPTFTPQKEILSTATPQGRACQGSHQEGGRYFVPYFPQKCDLVLLVGSEFDCCRVIIIEVIRLTDKGEVWLDVHEDDKVQTSFLAKEGDLIIYVRAGDYGRIEFVLEEIIWDSRFGLRGVWFRKPDLPQIPLQQG